MNLLEANLAALGRFQPTLVDEIKKTAPARELNLVPVLEAIPAVDALIVAGLPTAESWPNLLSGRAAYVLVSAADLGSLRTYLALMNIRSALDQGKVSFAVGDDGVLQLLNDLFGTLYRRKVTLFGRPGTALHEAALKDMKFFETLCASNRATLDQFAEEWQGHVSENIRDFIAGPFLQDQKGRWEGGDAAVVAAGPSLDEAGDASVFGGAQVVACDTAVPPLAARGIVPDLIVTLDSSEQNQTYLKNLPPVIYERSILCVTPLVERRVYEAFTHVLFYSYGHPTLDYFRECGMGFEPVATGGSVALTALDIARMLGVRRAYLLGFDFQSKRFRSHARGTGAALRALRTASRFQSVEQHLYDYQAEIESRPVAEFADAPSMANSALGHPWPAEAERDTLTDKKFQKWKEWLELYVKTNDDLTVLQMSDFSARIAGVKKGQPDRTGRAQIQPLTVERRPVDPQVRRELKFLMKEIEMTLSAPRGEILRRVTALPRVSKVLQYVLAWLSDKPPETAGERLETIVRRFHEGVKAAVS